MTKIVYGAYGSNLNKNQMINRCPSSKAIGSVFLDDWTIHFLGVANLVKAKNKKAPIGLFELTEECEKSLDKFEQYPLLYRKEFFLVYLNNKIVNMMTYIMQPGYETSPPSKAYFNSIYQGYLDFNFPTTSIVESLFYSLKNDSGLGYKSILWGESPVMELSDAYLYITK